MPSIFSGSILSSIFWLAVTSSSVRADLLLDGGDDFGWDTTEWRVQVDGVMGGESSGFLQFDNSDTIMDFSGNIILDGGGFSSVRKERFSAIDLAGYAGIVIQLEAVNAHNAASIQPPLGLHLQFHDTSSRYGFASAFAIPLASAVGEEISVYLPIESFDRGSRMGFQCNNCQLNYSSINEIDIYVLFQGGPFQVRVKSITAVENPQNFPSPVISITSSNEVKDLVESTIDSGGKLYDYSYGEICIAVYRSTLNTLFAAAGDDISDTIRGLVCEGLLRASTFSSIPDMAWTLRYTLDGVLEQLGYSDPDGGEGWRPNVETALSFSDQCRAVTSTYEEITGAFTVEPTTRPTMLEEIPGALTVEITTRPTMKATKPPTVVPTPHPSSPSTYTPTPDFTKMPSSVPATTAPTNAPARNDVTGESDRSSFQYPDSMVSQSDEEKDVSAGVVIGVVVVVVLFILAAVYCCFKSRKYHSRTDLNKTGTEEKQMDSSISLGDEGSKQPSSEDVGLDNPAKAEVL